MTIADGRNRFYNRLARVALVLAAGALVSGTLIGMLGYWWPALDLVNHFRHATFALAVIALVVALFISRRAAATLLVVSLVQGFYVVPELVTSFATPLYANAVAGRTLKIVSFNMHGAKTDPDAFRAFVAREAPHILVLQEASASVRPLVHSLSETLPYRADCIGRRLCALAILTRHRSSAATTRLPGIGPPIIKVDVTIDGRPVTIVGTHLSRPFNDMHALFDGRLQRQQLELLSTYVSERESDAVLLAGDFNAAPWSYNMELFEERVPLRRATRALFSWPVGCLARRFCIPVPLLPIDHIFASEDLAPVAVRRGPDLGSDHRPVVAVFAPR